MAPRLTVTNSERRTFTGCRKRYWFRYRERLEPMISAPPLRFGTLIHDCLKTFHLEKTVLFNTFIEQWRQAYVADVERYQNDQDFLGDVDTDKVDAMAKLANGMMLRYVNKYADDLRRWDILEFIELVKKYATPRLLVLLRLRWLLLQL